MNLSKTSLGGKLLILTFLGFVFSLGFVFNFILKNKQKNSLALITTNTALLYGQSSPNFTLPVRLKIPSIHVDSPIEYVGLMPDGTMGVPKGPATAAWFNLGPRPGEIGSSVIDGHSGWKNGMPAVFDNLYKLQKGDRLSVEDSKGGVATFVVREFRSYSPNEVVPRVFRSNDGKAHLNLITCTGVWNDLKRTHSNRLVVFTDREK